MIQDQDTLHIYPKSVYNDALKHVKTEWKMSESVTRYIAGVPISLLQAGIKMYGRNAKNNIILCDTPGMFAYLFLFVVWNNDQSL